MFEVKQGQIHGKTVADGWAGAVMQKPLAIQKRYLSTDGRTDRHGKVYSRVSATKNEDYVPHDQVSFAITCN